ncbi:MAG: tRNA-intron lyase [Nanoarchaeota archaeon]|nr:tRNA-intron lyase [Nanoarchaeota archaeon]
MVSGVLIGHKVIVSKEDKQYFTRKYFGEETDSGLELSLEEALFLKEKGKIDIIDKKGKKISTQEFIRTAQRANKRFTQRYAVFSDMRSHGYIIKTALKYGGDFRAYDKGEIPGQDHARWIVYVMREHDSLDARLLAAINRIAHSVKKSLLIAVVDDENSVTYYESNWMRL